MRKLLYIDLFCGAGGTTTGVENAAIRGKKCAEVIACVNHDRNAIASHTANHPNAAHFTEDIRTLKTEKLQDLLKRKKAEYPKSKTVLWASIECTNFSKAKGGLPRNADSRTLAEHLYRYIDALKPDYIQIENVMEFMSWGDLDEHGKPVSTDKGRKYLQWVKNICDKGYDYRYRILNSADYGAYTARKRYFGVFAKGTLPIVFPEPTHSKKDTNGLFPMQKWKPVSEVLDLSDTGQSIFGRRKPLCEATLNRIYKGLKKFATNKEETYLTTYYGNGGSHSIKEPSPTLTTKDRIAFINMQYGKGTPASVSEPAKTVTTNPKHNLVTCERKAFLMNPQFQSEGSPIDKPCFTLIATMNKRPPYLISAETGEKEKSEKTVKEGAEARIRRFMKENMITDIKMRMLKIEELKMIMGFPKDYILMGTQAEQKKYIGNAVEVNTAQRMCETLFTSINTKKMKEKKPSTGSADIGAKVMRRSEATRTAMSKRRTISTPFRGSIDRPFLVSHSPTTHLLSAQISTTARKKA